MKPPFPYYGGKANWAEEVWERLGAVDVYSEPFAGSLAVLLANEYPARREVVCDTDGHIANFWRAVQADPERVAWHADYPTIHQDLAARHQWLIRWALRNADNLTADAHWFDAKAAGWWVWGISLWIGGQWCTVQHDRMPFVDNKGGGRGVAKQRRSLGKMPLIHDQIGGSGVSKQRRSLQDKRPMVDNRGGGAGVSKQRRSLQDKRPYVDDRGGGQGVSKQRRSLQDKRPYVDARGGGQGVSKQRRSLGQMPHDRVPKMSGWIGGSGVSKQRFNLSERRPHVNPHLNGMGVSKQRSTIAASSSRGDRLQPFFFALCKRLENVIVLNRDWSSAVTPSVIGDTASCGDYARAVFLDPPYKTDRRSSTLYSSDADGSSDDVATAAYAWAVEHGDRYRIAYCCHDGDFPVPEGWESLVKGFNSHRVGKADTNDMIMFSPACRRQESLL